ncbi:unnamed protein product (macronuclear) [Paramecium tetraurelia]|uniref:Uncharacterized protein n=1 Tax=Paramecium tetraurelia TaxID=5888 RepID=A0C1C1_PARTE|nr:uncharacterized protein GSPATT00034064001 [Paramecium tetraurelia]CAK64588.1 unnamed protein product [Paramecium tetraurelia]|eukprot:XP_001431986.1 hypothetical protein (macronuclear) [Paramecium tetraurelia strain d4-2]
MSLNPKPQVLCEGLQCRSRFLQKRCNYYKKSIELLRIQLYQAETPKKLSESKVSVASTDSNFSTLADENDSTPNLQEKLQQKQCKIYELKEAMLTLQSKVNSLQAQNDEMQIQLSKQHKEFLRNDKVTHSVNLPKSTSQTEKAMAVIDKFIQPFTVNSFKSQDGKPPSTEEKRKMIKRMSMNAGASAFMMAMKGDYTTLQSAFEEIQSNNNLEQS